MKKTVSLILAAVMLLLSTALSVSAGEISPQVKRITYHLGFGSPESYTQLAYGDSALTVDSKPDNGWVTREGYAFAGWAESADGAVKYLGGEKIENGSAELYAVWCPTYLEKDEVFRFSNSKSYFTTDERDTYLLSKENADMLQKNIYKTFGTTPIPGVALSIALSTYPNWKWKGSCYGISTVTALRHYNLLDADVLGGAESLSDLSMSDELMSLINYYQANAATSWLCENKALKPGTAGYASSMKAMFESVKKGNIVLYTFYEGNAFVTAGHTVLLTGAYEDTEGNHYFVAYDCNHPYRYTNGRKTDRFVLSPDYRHMTDDTGDSVGAANWTDSFSQFDSFNVNGNGKVSSWYSAFFAQIGQAFMQLFSSVKM